MFDACPQCDGKHVIFGQVISGFEILDEIEDMDPIPSVTITDTGIYHPFETSPCGYWYDQPDQSYNGYTPTFVTKPRILIVLPNPSAKGKFTSILQNFALVQFIIPSSSVEEVRRSIMSYLEDYKVDLVFVALACRQFALEALPNNWGDAGVTVQNTIFVMKPVDALSALKSSWIAKNSNWIFDFK